jgi:hypothetical protein
MVALAISYVDSRWLALCARNAKSALERSAGSQLHGNPRWMKCCGGRDVTPNRCRAVGGSGHAALGFDAVENPAVKARSQVCL